MTEILIRDYAPNKYEFEQNLRRHGYKIKTTNTIYRAQCPEPGLYEAVCTYPFSDVRERAKPHTPKPKSDKSVKLCPSCHQPTTTVDGKVICANCGYVEGDNDIAEESSTPETPSRELRRCYKCRKNTIHFIYSDSKTCEECGTKSESR